MMDVRCSSSASRSAGTSRIGARSSCRPHHPHYTQRACIMYREQRRRAALLSLPPGTAQACVGTIPGGGDLDRPADRHTGNIYCVGRRAAAERREQFTCIHRTSHERRMALDYQSAGTAAPACSTRRINSLRRSRCGLPQVERATRRSIASQAVRGTRYQWPTS